MINLLHVDCMDFMRTQPDKVFDLAIVDPPYGLPKDSVNGRGKLRTRALNTMDMAWDIPPPKAYFEELFRVSRNQIILGSNYFPLPPTRCVFIWDKLQPWKNFSAFELAWTSFDKPARIFRKRNCAKGKIHPTQKPVELYAWILEQFATPGMRILDTHLGSGSSAIAAHDAGFDFTGCEINIHYFNAMMERFNEHEKQGKLAL